MSNRTLDYLDYWVLHSPYPDKTWRGIEKCAGTKQSTGPLLFESREEAIAFMKENACDPYFIPVKVELGIPHIRTYIGDNL